MKIDKDIKSLWDKANNLANCNGPSNEIIVYDDDYHIETGSIPPRFLAYRHARWEKLDDWGRLTCEDVDKTVTLDELEFSLKSSLRLTPEERYQAQKANRFFHDKSSYMQGLSIDDWDKGCHDQQCIPECRFYPDYGTIENEEVINEHNERVERYRRENRIVEPPSESEMIRLLNELKHLF